MKRRHAASSLSLQPILFDKLCLGASMRTSLSWREIILRDIENLLNDGVRSATMQHDGLAYTERSVLNHGLPPFARVDSGVVDPRGWATQLQRILRVHEPRLDPRTIRVAPVLHGEARHVLAVLYDISGTLATGEGPVPLSFRIALDYSCRSVRIVD